MVRKKGVIEALKRKHIVPTFKHGGGNVMVWGAIGPQGVGDLHKMNGRYKAVDYRRKILTPYARNSLVKCTGLPLDQAIFQQLNSQQRQ